MVDHPGAGGLEKVAGGTPAGDNLCGDWDRNAAASVVDTAAAGALAGGGDAAACVVEGHGSCLSAR